MACMSREEDDPEAEPKEGQEEEGAKVDNNESPDPFMTEMQNPFWKEMQNPVYKGSKTMLIKALVIALLICAIPSSNTADYIIVYSYRYHSIFFTTALTMLCSAICFIDVKQHSTYLVHFGTFIVFT